MTRVLRIARSWMLLLTLVLAGPVQGAGLVVPQQVAAVEIKLESYLDRFEDMSARLGVVEVAAPANAGRFVPVVRQGQNYGFRESALWFRVQVDFSRVGTSRNWVLLETHAIVDHVTFYVPDGRGGWHETALGDAQPYRERKYDHREFVAPVPESVIAGPQPVTFYVREAGDGALNVDLRLTTPQALLERTNTESLVFGLCYGALLLVFVYNLYLWLLMRETAHAYYLAFVGFAILLFLNLDGLGLQYLWPSYPVINTWFPLMVCLLMWTGLHFTRHFLDLSDTSIRMDRVVRAVAYVPVLALVLVFTILSQRDGYRLATVLPAAMILFMVGLGVWRMSQGFVPARYFVAGWVSTLVGAIATAAGYFRMIDTNYSPIDFARLGIVVQISFFAMAVASRISLMKADNNRMERALLENALRDSLTGLPNRHALQRDMQALVPPARNGRLPSSVLHIRVNNHKRISHTFGPAAADEMICVAAERIASTAGVGSRLFRAGEDEFILVTEAVSGVAAIDELCREVLAALGAPVTIGGMVLQLHCNIGVAVATGSPDDPMLLIEQAQIACMTLPDDGEGGRRLFTADMGDEASRSAALGNELPAALRGGGVVMRYLPSVDSRTGRFCALEASPYWKHPVYGEVTEDELVQISGEAGHSAWLEQWVLEAACADADRLKHLIKESVRISIAISPRLFQRADFVELLAQTLAQTGLSGANLQLNVGESVLASGIGPAREKLDQCRRLGVQVSVIDLGTGKSSLTSLLHLQINRIRIDGNLIRNVISDGRDAAVVKGIIAMAHHLGLRVLAEHVDTLEQAAFLRRFDCDELQGDFEARPMTIDEVEQYLYTRSSVVAGIEGEGGEALDKILLLDDEPNIIRAISRVLRRDNYQILAAENTEQAFALLARHDVRVIISDQRMPGMLGTEFLARVKDLYPHTTRMVLSGYADLSTVTDAINKGAVFRFLTKPWDDDKLREEVRGAISLSKAQPQA